MVLQPLMISMLINVIFKSQIFCFPEDRARELLEVESVDMLSDGFPKQNGCVSKLDLSILVSYSACTMLIQKCSAYTNLVDD